MKKLFIKEDLKERGFKVESQDGRFSNRVSAKDLIQLTKRVTLVNDLEDEEPVKLFAVTVEDYDNEFDVVVTKFTITDDSDNMDIQIVDEYSKTYKRLKAAEKYADTIRRELNQEF